MSDFLKTGIEDDNICLLVPENNTDEKYVLLDKEPLTLGRTKQSGFTNPRMSKCQMKFEADYSMGQVLVEQIGCNKSAINGQSMVKGEKRILHHGDKISLLFKDDNYNYHLNFKCKYPNYGIKSNKRPSNCNNQEISPKRPHENLTAKWEKRDGSLLVFNSANLVHRDKIAAFDMDGTIIVTQSGKVFPVDYKDWKISFPEVTKSIRELSQNGYKIVIFTNQGGIGLNKVNEEPFKKKVENIIDIIKTPVQVFVATKSDKYRKPAPGMWNIFTSDYNGGLPVNVQSSFFCGDAAGRPARTGSNGQKLKKDHSCCDRLFAMNIGLKFFTPEQYFWKTPAEEFNLPIFNSKNIMDNDKYTNLSSILVSSKQEMIIMVGSPGSGKSHFASNKLGCHKSIKIVNRDTLGTWQKCVNLANDYLTDNNKWSVVIDNTNPDIESRKRFIDLAKSLNIPCRIFLMNISKEHAKHNNKFRELTDEKHQKVTDTIINVYYSKFEEPCVSEGVEEVVKIHFVPNFKNSEQEALYKMYLL